MTNLRTEESPLVRDNVRKDSRLNKEIVMTTKSAFSAVGLAHKVCLSAEAQGYTPELLNTLAEHPDLFHQLLQVQRGHASVTTVEHVIDCDASPFVPDGRKVEEHQKGGQFKFDASQIEFYLSAAQKKDRIEGIKLRKELAGKPVLNANVLDYLLKNPHLIPEDWKKGEKDNSRYIFFWGTVFRNSDDCQYVCYLFWNGDRWCRRDYLLGSAWFDYDPAALRKNVTITTVEHVIDCDVSPFVPNGWEVEEHQKGGQFKFDVSQINLYLSATQKNGIIEGNKLRKELADKPVLNANVLDYLLANPHLIPEEWKGKYVFFWGTIYRGSGGDLGVRSLCWRGGRRYWGDRCLAGSWNGSNPAALRAS